MESNSILSEIMMIERTLSGRLDQVASTFPVVLLTGPRQVGKTTLLLHFAQGRYGTVTLDDLGERELARTDPALFLAQHKPPVLIDEIQYAPQLMTAIKIYVDRHPGENGLFLLTGSQKFHLMRGVQESLAGRLAVLNLLGLSQAELSGNPQRAPFLSGENWLGNAKDVQVAEDPLALYENIWRGSFPALVANTGVDRELYFSSYLTTYIERDVRSAVGIGDPIAFKNFVRAAAARTGQLLNYADMARDVGIDAKTARSWLGILEMSGLVYLLHPLYRNVTKRIVKTPKLYFLDTGLCAYLTEWESAKTLAAGAMSGAILETYVFSEILKSWWNYAREPSVSFYRDSDQKEIDFLLEKNGILYPVEVKRSMTPTAGAGRHFSILQKQGLKVGPGVILDMRPQPLQMASNLFSIPISAL